MILYFREPPEQTGFRKSLIDFNVKIFCIPTGKQQNGQKANRACSEH